MKHGRPLESIPPAENVSSADETGVRYRYSDRLETHPIVAFFRSLGMKGS